MQFNKINSQTFNIVSPKNAIWLKTTKHKVVNTVSHSYAEGLLSKIPL